MATTVLLDYTCGMKESKRYSQKVLAAMTGKTQKFSKEHSSGFVSDYRNAVETMGESEGFGSSGRVDTEMTASEDSFVPKRKCISLNVDRCDSLGVPLQVLPVSKMSQSERKDLEMRLRAELEEVKVLQKKIAFRSANGVVGLSSSNDIRGCIDGQNMPPLENFRRSSEMSSGQGKKRAPPGLNGAHLKRGTSGRFESVKQGAAPSSTSNVMLMKQCETLLKRLMSHQFGWVFNTPVDAEKLNIPDYFQVIRHPMDLGTVKRKIASGTYSSPLDFVADVRLTFSNAMTYNPPGNDVHIMADTLRKYFEKRWESIEKKFLSADLGRAPVKPSLSREIETAKPMPPSKKRKISAINQNVMTEPVKRIMTDAEKHNLSRELESLGDMPEHIVDFLRGHSFNGCQNGEEEIEVDIDALGDDTLFMLRKLLDDYLRDKQINQTKAEPCEIEILNDSGLSNSSMPCKGNEPVDEDVDIGGNDPPVSSYPPVEIEKDTTRRNSKCNSSNSSSSEAGSSSSDSDSGSSSGSESEGAKASSPVNPAKENLGSGEDIEQRRSDLIDPHDGTQSVGGVDQVEQNSQTWPLSVEADRHQGDLGENAPSERQVSPEKLYRAALLRSRFADTILKAREKALDKGEKGDPEKLRREREELERQQREEKVRLQAEAKAAEDARRRAEAEAEAEAAAEAKRKRELEREAARQALQKMERTVEINENCQFLEDLEMLRGAPTKHLPSSVDETSPDHSQDGIGCFTLQGSSNPLEQLGLYMKVDDEEEEEVEPQSVPDPVKDVEEGEID